MDRELDTSFTSALNNDPPDEKKEATTVPEETEMEQFPTPPRLRRTKAYRRQPKQSSVTADEPFYATAEEQKKNSVESLSESGDDTDTEDEDVYETGSDSEGSSYDSYSSEEYDEGEETDKDHNPPPTKKKKTTTAEVEDVVRKYLNSRFELSKNSRLFSENFFL